MVTVKVNGKNGILWLVMLMVIGFCHVAYGADDWAFWQDANVNVQITDDLKLKLNQEAKFRDDFSEYFYIHSDVKLMYRLFSWMDVGASFRHIEEKGTSGDWENEERPYVEMALKTELSGFKISTRARLERRIRTNKSDRWRFRNKLTVTPPVKWTPFEIQPYIADEIFFTIEDNRFDQNRIYAGIKSKLTETLSAKFYYMWKLNYQSSTSIWRASNVLGGAVSMKF